jgi:hypothetical protein
MPQGYIKKNCRKLPRIEKSPKINEYIKKIKKVLGI